MPIFSKSYEAKYKDFDVPHLEELRNIPDYDLLSPCEFYRILDKQCRTISNEVTSLWISGERANCEKWKDAYENCERWKKSKDRESLEKVLDMERSMFKMRQVDIFLNNVWKLRDSTKDSKEPTFFNAPLPPFLRKDDE